MTLDYQRPGTKRRWNWLALWALAVGVLCFPVAVLILLIAVRAFEFDPTGWVLRVMLYGSAGAGWAFAMISWWIVERSRRWLRGAWLAAVGIIFAMLWFLAVMLLDFAVDLGRRAPAGSW